MPTRLRPSSANYAWIACQAVALSYHGVSPFVSPSSSLIPETRSSILRCGSNIQRRSLAYHSLQHNIRRQQQLTRNPTAINLGVEDIIFNAQNAGSTLANTVISSGSSASSSSISSLLILYTAGLWTSFSPCSLGLLPITVSYITTAAQERKDKNTILPTLVFAAGLALVFTALGVSASALGGVFGSNGGGGGGDDPIASLLLAAVSSLVSVLMGLQLLEVIRIPLPSLDFKWRNAAAFDSGSGASSGSLFDETGGLILDNLQSNQEAIVNGSGDGDDGKTDDENSDELASLIRTFLLGGTSALVASPCATPVLASLLAYLASVSSDASSSGDLWKGASWMLSYTLGYSTPLLAVGATGGQALVNLQKARDDNVEGFNLGSFLGQWVTPLTGGVLITFGMNGFLVALLGDPSLSGLAPIID
ncbi:hypothetical protein ACHAXR_012060 [Thalassiosira sp. AJA248-18]